jgi:hypothetical protein
MVDNTIPLAYGVVIESNDRPALHPHMELRTATQVNGGRSSRVLLPRQNDASPQFAESTYRALEEQGYTRGLSQAFLRNKVAFPLRFWIVDNSGSMNTQDGHRLSSKNKSKVELVPCTRWAEMQQTVDYHAQMAALIQSPTVFRLLNDPGRVVGPQQFSIAERGPQFLDEDLAIAQSAILNTRPSGVTPLTQHIQEIRANVVELEPTLRQDGAKVVIVLATDGIPTDSQGHQTDGVERQFVNALKSLEGLPVWIVVRLCTDDDNVVAFWNGLDSQLELSLEVLDDFSAEAKEVHALNEWLNYGLPLHRMREMGFYHRVLDLMDERKLTKDELGDFCRLLFGQGKMDGVPDAQDDWNGFLTAITALVNRESKQWNPMTKRMEPWLNITLLKRTYGSSGWFW